MKKFIGTVYMSYFCKICGTEWDDEAVFHSLIAYGFINLSNKHDEYIAFSCPGRECHALIYFNGPLGISQNFHSAFVSYLDPCGNNEHDAQIKYFGTLPFSMKNKSFLANNGAICSSQEPLRLHEVGFSSGEGKLHAEYYCSLNNNQLVAYGEYTHVWWYKKESIEYILDTEGSARLCLFPRYMCVDETLDKINTYYELHDFDIAKNEDSENVSCDLFSESYYQTAISKQYAFLKLITPLRYYPLDNIDDAIRGFNEISALWRLFHDSYVSEQLIKQSYTLINKLIELYSKSKFSSYSTKGIIAECRRNIFDGLVSRRKRDDVREKSNKDLTAQSINEAPGFSNILSVDGNVSLVKIKISRMLNKSKKVKPILLTGETGVGKTYFAEAIHKASGRSGKYINVNMGEVPGSLFESIMFGHVKGAFTGADNDNEGKFYAANGGTLLLDEIGNIDTASQSKLLKVLEDMEVCPVGSSTTAKLDVLIVFGTNVDLNEAVVNNKFRLDLLYRINKNPFVIPPLRHRRNDILLLSKHFIREFGKSCFDEKWANVNISDEAVVVLRGYRWPGNIRQLQGVIESILGQRIEDDFSDISPLEVKEVLLLGGIGTEVKSSAFDVSGDVTCGKFAMHNGLPDFNPGPGMRKIPDRDDLVAIIQYFYEQLGKERGVRAKVARHIGIEPKYVSAAIAKYEIVLPWESLPSQLPPI